MLQRSLAPLGRLVLGALLLSILVGSSTALAGAPIRIAPADTMYFSSQLGAVMTESVVIENLTSETIKVYSYFQGDANFKVDVPREITIHAHGQEKFTITYVPNALTVIAHGILTFKTNNYVEHLVLLGHGKNSLEVSVSPEVLDFGTIKRGEKVCKSITITNNSAGTIKAKFSLGHYTEDFNIPTDVNEIEIAAKSHASFDVCFEPKSGELYTRDVVQIVYVDHNGHENHLTVHLTGAVHHEIDTTVHNCLMAPKEVFIGPAMVGSSAEGHIYLVNNGRTTITITRGEITGINEEGFKITSTFPIVIQAQGKAIVNVEFSPTDANIERYAAGATLYLEGADAGCESNTIIVYGEILRDHREDIRNPIFNETKQAIGIKWDANVHAAKLIFFNNLQEEVTVNGVSLRDGSKFKIFGTSPVLPATLQPGAELILEIQITALFDGHFTDEIIFETDHSTAGESNFDLQGLKQLASVEPGTSMNVRVTLAPNPAREQVRIETQNAASASIEICDILGSVVAKQHGTSWTWQAADQSGQHVADGVYFVRVTGVTTEGEPFVSTTQVVVAR